MPRQKKKRILWTAADLKLLRRLAGRQNIKRIARELKRTEAAVRYKAFIRGISVAAR